MIVIKNKTKRRIGLVKVTLISINVVKTLKISKGTKARYMDCDL